jgi:hypothetical protein
MFGGNGRWAGRMSRRRAPAPARSCRGSGSAGATYHIYFHKNGQREVIALPKAGAQPAAAAGGAGGCHWRGVLAPS